MNAGMLTYRLQKPGLLRKLIVLESVSSTNEYAFANNLESDTLVIAPEQVSGKGRFGRAWHSSPGKNISLTLVKNFRISVDEIHNVGFYSSLKLLEAIRDSLTDRNFTVSLKWPNDVLLNGKKVAGMLLDSRDLKNPVKRMAIGIGVNVNEESFEGELAGKATSVLIETGSEASIEELVVSFLQKFYDELLLTEDSIALMNKWRSYCNHIGKEVRFRLLADGEEKLAFVEDINSDGSLKLRSGDGAVRSYYSGEISLIVQQPAQPA